MSRLFWEQWEFTEKKATAQVFHVPSVDTGIVFEVTAELTGSCSKRLKERALTVALSAVVEVVAPIAKRFDVSCADACEALANRACMAIRKPHRQLRVHSVALTFSAARSHIEAAAHLAALRRIAAVAGREAVREAARADALQQVVLDNHAAMVAHLLLTREPEEHGDLAGDAARLVRGVEDLRPSQPWIRVIEAITSLRDRHEPEDVKKMASDLAVWAGMWDQPLAQTLQNTISEEDEEQSSASGLDGQGQGAR
jgi:hypothetical protein